jgi:hypothetical protein
MKKIMPQSFTLIAVSFASIIALSNEANASVTLQPVSASTDMGEYARVDAAGTVVFSASHVIDQSELSPQYTSSVSDFDGYLASNPIAYHGLGSASWGSFEGVRSGTFDLNLGGDYTVSAMALWNLTNDPSAIREFNILLDDNPSFSSPARFNGFTASNSLGPGNPSGYSFAKVFTFDPTIAHFVRLEILNTWSPSSFGAGFNEVMFGVSPVPEPETYAMLLTGLGLFGFMARRRKTA